MAKILVVFLIAAIFKGLYGMEIRHKRQSSDNEDGLDERYGWDRPRQMPSRFPNPNGLPGQNQFPWQNQNQNGGHNQFPWQNQNQNGGQGQFPWQNQNQNDGQNQNQNGGQGSQGQFPWRTSTTQAPIPTGSTALPSSVRDCISSCPVTPEYNPVCGSDSVTYTNPGRLGCAQACGVNVTLLRSSPCPTTTTAAPAS